MEIVEGEFIVFLDNDDELLLFVLYEVVKVLNVYLELDVIYSDEDKIDVDGNCFDLYFKVDWLFDILMGNNYIFYLGVYWISIVKEFGGFCKGYEGF